MNQETNEGLSDSTESSLYSESIDSRIPCNAQPRQTARILLEKRRQELPKLTPIEQAYMRNSTSQIPYHPLKQPASNGIIQTIKEAHINQIKQLENQIAEDQIKINELVTELRTMKTQQKRLELELKKYQGMAGNIPTYMRGQKEEMRTVQHELKKIKMQNMRLAQNLASRDHELKKVKQENQRWRRLEDVMQLEDREKLFDENEDLKHQISRQNDKIMMLTRKGMLEVKNLKHELTNERKKHRATQQSLANTLESSEKLRSDLELKQKYITYNSLRFAGGHQKKPATNGLGSISLITLTGSRFGGAQAEAPMRLDPELVRHYPKTPTSPPRTPTCAVAKRSELSAGSRVNNTHRNTPVLLERAPMDRSNHTPHKDMRNSPLRKSPLLPLPKIQNDLEEEEDGSSLSEQGSDLSEEDINVYSSSLSSHSDEETPVTNSRKSSLDLRKNLMDEASDSETKLCEISENTRKNGLSLPNLVAKDSNHGDGKPSWATRDRVSRGERKVSIGEKSSTTTPPPKNQNQSPTEGGGDGKQSRTSNGRRRNVLERRSPPVTREQKLAREYAEIEERVKCEKTRSEAIRTQYEGYLKFDTEVKHEMDQASKGKLLAALNAIEKGGDPVKMSPLKAGGPKRATIFTATRPRSPIALQPPPTVDQRVTQDLHAGRPTRRNVRSPEPDPVRLSALDLFKSGSPLEHPMTKSELIKELFGGGAGGGSNGMEYTSADIVPPTRNNMSFHRLSDNNNNEPAEADAIYAAPRVSLTNWKH